MEAHRYGQRNIQQIKEPERGRRRDIKKNTHNLFLKKGKKPELCNASEGVVVDFHTHPQEKGKSLEKRRRKEILPRWRCGPVALKQKQKEPLSMGERAKREWMGPLQEGAGKE